MSINFNDPIWSIEHVALALQCSVDTAREHSYHSDFPAPKALFAKNLWSRDEVLSWFTGLPDRAPRPSVGRRSAARITRGA